MGGSNWVGTCILPWGWGNRIWVFVRTILYEIMRNIASALSQLGGGGFNHMEQLGRHIKSLSRALGGKACELTTPGTSSIYSSRLISTEERGLVIHGMESRKGELVF